MRSVVRAALAFPSLIATWRLRVGPGRFRSLLARPRVACPRPGVGASVRGRRAAPLPRAATGPSFPARRRSGRQSPHSIRRQSRAAHGPFTVSVNRLTGPLGLGELLKSVTDFIWSANPRPIIVYYRSSCREGGWVLIQFTRRLACSSPWQDSCFEGQLLTQVTAHEISAFMIA